WANRAAVTRFNHWPLQNPPHCYLGSARLLTRKRTECFQSLPHDTVTALSSELKARLVELLYMPPQVTSHQCTRPRESHAHRSLRDAQAIRRFGAAQFLHI